MELLDGFIFCQSCGQPMLSDGEGHYQHITEIQQNRLRELLRDRLVAGKVFDWLCTLELACPCCGPRPNPFKDIERDRALASLGTNQGANDFFCALRDIFDQEHPKHLTVEAVVREAENIVKGDNIGE